MDIKLKKYHNRKIIKLPMKSQIQEILVNTYLLSPEKEKIQICFRGHDNSGIIELSPKEAEHLTALLNSQINISKNTRIIR